MYSIALQLIGVGAIMILLVKFFEGDYKYNNPSENINWDVVKAIIYRDPLLAIKLEKEYVLFFLCLDRKLGTKYKRLVTVFTKTFFEDERIKVLPTTFKRKIVTSLIKRNTEFVNTRIRTVDVEFDDMCDLDYMEMDWIYTLLEIIYQFSPNQDKTFTRELDQITVSVKKIENLKKRNQKLEEEVDTLEAIKKEKEKQQTTLLLNEKKFNKMLMNNFRDYIKDNNNFYDLYSKILVEIILKEDLLSLYSDYEKLPNSLIALLYSVKTNGFFLKQ